MLRPTFRQKTAVSETGPGPRRRIPMDGSPTLRTLTPNADNIGKRYAVDGELKSLENGSSSFGFEITGVLLASAATNSSTTALTGHIVSTFRTGIAL